MVGSLVNGLGVVLGWWHNIIQIHNIMLCATNNISRNILMYSLTQSERGRIFCGRLSVPQNIIMDLNNVLSLNWFGSLFITFSSSVPRLSRSTSPPNMCFSRFLIHVGVGLFGPYVALNKQKRKRKKLLAFNIT